ncbi:MULTISPECIES: 3D-(3,5/4)-trihydroxycyclohexane-1,2-dione acylhydrolase (decyclizing) [unclassified Pseudomonas]|uniref:3D-(3,5/4)-trihydroxycyclohexane-1,2-dione acylhydrolase (decyclizing) n=1 Tax=unclassified Pseudomonas TaxID=196821 RepID=UPI002ACB07D4|nr:MULTISPECIES: 3D-(3,5/4)-trihydroxycyclohexane-1,2-dione acylhydrolase (decyclizing) [unclassified Pseudomonas]MEB0040856.1 3D-(3,5/4)-trihydroxycyclohexane-1,2-dione acylhydrolase (decyclizing) [Pseudomonas sp. MH10]MEB0090216.1 3D-(3,5/4)-trihydroxycyclohexane-1,2-dione acylhydrolase (decyclizing) [Pseudomonas sp. CCI4.2]MEB0119419.1 3D-(3,5/4)-trihydroxycyclohexane-1,2-dione acylhydrolase (decyclizing) [Pseudomonas sp. CCI1.2]WPX52009.1 3D-(3,5/4)-trihydroxycyclohexane-1,2-dione acylhydro
MKTTRLTMAQALVKFLDNQYVEVDGVESKFVAGVFTIFGHGNVLGIGQALEQDSGQLIVHQGRNEQGMCHAAIGFAKQHLRRKIYACSSSVGPGAANMLTAAATATANRIPLLLLPGDVYASRQPDPVLQQIEQFHDLSISTNDAFKAVSKYWDRINRPEQLMSAAINAMRVLTDPAETGAVTLALPQDVQAQAYDYPDSFLQKRVHRIDRRPASDAMLGDALTLLKGKRKPLLVCGGGVRYSGAADALQAFAERFDIPFAETQAGKSAIVSAHPLNMGGLGETGSLAANLLAKQADLIIGIGTRYSDFTTASKWLFQNPDVQFLNLNVSAFDAQKLDGVQLVADAKFALLALTDALNDSGYRSAWGDQPHQARARLDAEVDRIYAVEYQSDDFVPEINDHLDPAVLREFIEMTGSCLTQSRVLGVLNASLPRDAVIVAAAGSLPGDLQRAWRTTAVNSYHVEYGFSCMGYEVNAALGVKLAEPQREVYALVGDGSYMMLHSELATSIQERCKINVILLDNMTFGCINNLQMEHGMDSFGTEFRFRNPETGKLDGDFVPVDFAMSAAAYGCKTYKVTTIAELEAALLDAQKQTVSTLIDIKVLPKTMIHKYLSWWRVGVAEVSTNGTTAQVFEKLSNELAKARKY